MSRTASLSLLCSTRHLIRLLLSFAALASLEACATDRPLAVNCPQFETYRIPLPETPGMPEGGMGAADAGPSPLAAEIAETFGTAAASETGHRSQILVLSGGGEWGAFGAGFLKGWSTKGAGDMARPERFDVVTGVSTGALQATFAFLGKPYDEQLQDAYAIADERQLLKRHGNLFFVSHASMADTRPLEAFVRARLRPLLDAVAAPENAGRKLLVGTVDGMSGRMYAVDLTRMARELNGREREDCYVGALLASSAVPVVFRQLSISGHPYLDGGVRQSIFVTGIQAGAHEALNDGSRKGTIYIIMNGDIAPSSVTSLPPKLLPTLGRLRSIVFNQVELASIFGAARTYPEMQTFVATAGGHSCEPPPDEKNAIFSPAMMRCLSSYGEKLWSGPVPWQAYYAP